MQHVIMTKGLPGSGKTFFSKELTTPESNFRRVNKDDIRSMVQGTGWSRESEKLVLSIRDSLIMGLLWKGYDIIVDDTNLHPKHEKRVNQLIDHYKKKSRKEVKFSIQDFTDIPIQTCIKQDLERAKSVGESVIRNMYATFLEDRDPFDDIEYTKQDASLPKAILVDLDGTTALLNGRNPYNAGLCHNDSIHTPVYDLLKRYYEDGVNIIFLSGRHGVYLEYTKKWLIDKKIKYNMLLLRGKDDSRKSTIVKKEMFYNNVHGKYNILFALEDKTADVNMYRDELGIPCFQVNHWRN